MKNVLFIIALLAGFGLSEVNAQACILCPPGCCILSCCSQSRASAASVQLMPASLDATASCTPEAMKACKGMKVSKKEMKSCQAAHPAGLVPACQPQSAGTPTPMKASAPLPGQAGPTPMKG